MIDYQSHELSKEQKIGVRFLILMCLLWVILIMYMIVDGHGRYEALKELNNKNLYLLDRTFCVRCGEKSWLVNPKTQEENK